MTHLFRSLMITLPLVTFSLVVEAQTISVVSSDGTISPIDVGTRSANSVSTSVSVVANSRDISVEAKVGVVLESNEPEQNSLILKTDTTDIETSMPVSEVIERKPTVETAARAVETALLDGKTIRFNGVLFEHDKASLKPSAVAEIAALARALKARTDTRVRIEGHTDDRGNKQYNLQLSVRRAEAVVAALVVEGISRERFDPVGFGFSRPVASNGSEEGRALNRRVDIVPID